MATWNNKKPACVMTWITLAILDQSTKAFPQSENVKVKQLAFWTSSSSDEIREARRRPLAITIDAVFRDMAGSKYESGVSKKKAVLAIIDSLRQGDLKMPDLAQINDEHYRFLGEGD